MNSWHGIHCLQSRSSMATPPRANLSREEPDAGNLHVRLCEGWGRQRPHLLGIRIAASVLFSWYVASFGSYNKTYGSLGAIIGFMTWIWISIIVVLVGAKIDAEMEHQTARETTTGKPKPL